MPIHADDYVHRIGRTGRAGRTGHAYMLATPRDAKYVDVIEKLIGKPLARRSMMDIEVREENRPRREGRDGKGGRGRDRGRNGKRHDRRPPDGKFHEHVASMEPAEVRAEAPAAEAPQVQEPQQNQKSGPRPEKQQERHREKRGSQRQHNEQAARPEAVDKSELPAFLFRPVPVRKPVS